MSKFKLVMFDREGGVRAIEESQKHSKCTRADMFFVPFNHMRLTPMFPLKFYAEDKETPLQFHLLEGKSVLYSSSLVIRLNFIYVYKMVSSR